MRSQGDTPEKSVCPAGTHSETKGGKNEKLRHAKYRRTINVKSGERKSGGTNTSEGERCRPRVIQRVCVECSLVCNHTRQLDAHYSGETKLPT